MIEWTDVACTSCKWQQQYPKGRALFAYKCAQCSGGSYFPIDEQVEDAEDTKVEKERDVQGRSTAMLDLEKLSWSQLIRLVVLLAGPDE